MNIALRPFTEHDLPAIAQVYNAIYTDRPRTVAEWQFEHEHRDPRLNWHCTCADQDGSVVGYAIRSHLPWAWHPQKWMLVINVLPAYQGRGVGRALYDQVCADLAAHDPINMGGQVHETHERALRFFADRGFVEQMRLWESRLDTSTFDWTPYADIDERMRAQGITIKTLNELADDPDHLRKLYTLVTATAADSPTTEPYTPPDFDVWVAARVQHPSLIRDAYFVALHNQRYVGLTNLHNMESSEHLWTGFTGTLREYRGRGIALALKLRAVGYAQAHGRRFIYTDNASTNQPMLAINGRLGFQRLPAWLWLVKQIKEDA